MPLSIQQRQRVLDSIAAGRLPSEGRYKIYAGHGDGHECAGCGEVIDQTQVEYEATYADGRAYRLHLGCAALWDAKLRQAETIKDAGRIREESQATRELAHGTAKESGRLRDRADVLGREAESAREQWHRVQRGGEPSKG